MITIGRSQVVASLLLKVASDGGHLYVVVLDGRPDAAGEKAYKVYAGADIPTTVMLDSEVGYMTEKADMVVVGAEGVIENRGIVNKMGAYVMGITDMDLGKLLYVAADSYKLARLFPMNYSDLTEMGPEAGLSFVDTAIWEVTGVVVGTRPFLLDWILLCELRGLKLEGKRSDDTMTI